MVAPIFIEAVEDGENDAIHTLNVDKTDHRPGSSPHLDKTALDDVRRSQGAPEVLGKVVRYKVCKGTRKERHRKGEFESAWLPERKGQDPELKTFLAETFLAGCSTRDLARITGKHLGKKYDSKQISRIVARASQDLEAWRVRRLEGRKYKFLYVDGANFAVRINGQVSRQSFCAVLGVSEEGECFEVLAVERGTGSGRICGKTCSAA